MLEVRALSPMILVLAVLEVPNVLLNNKEEEVQEEEDTQVEEVGFNSPSKQVGEVTVVVVGGVAVCHNNKSMLEDPLSTKVEEGEGLPS